MSYHEEVLLGPKKLLPKLHSIMDIVSSFYFSESVSLFSILSLSLISLMAGFLEADMIYFFLTEN